MFDESYNYVTKKSQMDLHIRYWNEIENKVGSRYYSSEFLGKTAAVNLLDSFIKCLSKLDKSKLIQVSSDGPNVNLAFLKLLNEKRKDEELCKLIDIGTCGLHVLHGSFKHGEEKSEWKLKKLLSSRYKIFHESPSRRADYELITEASENDYPLPFCAHRWVENERVAKKARAMWDKIPVIVDYWKTLSKAKQPGQGKLGANTSYDHLCVAHTDVLIPVKLLFFEEVAKSLNAFLVLFQMDNPMVPFLVETLDELIRSLFSKFILKYSTSATLLKIDPTDVVNHKSIADVDLGFAINYELQLLKKCNFKKAAVQFLSKLCSHALEKSPLRSLFARCMQCLSPTYIAECPESCILKYEKILTKLVEYKIITPSSADVSKLQYQNFISTIARDNKNEFMTFDKALQRSDVFLWKFIGGSSNFFTKILLILSHGQAHVERGFSVNSQILIENLHTENLIVQRLINDHMVFHGLKSNEIKITNKLLDHVKQARSRYFSSQKEHSLQGLKSSRDMKITEINQQIEDMNRNTIQLQKNINSLIADADIYTFDAEKKSKLEDVKHLLSRSNALKRAANEKEDLLESIVTKKRLLLQKKEGL